MVDSRARRIGALLAVGIPGPTIDSDTRRWLEDLQPGCVVLFRRNFVDADRVGELTDALHALASQPLVAIDQEGGRVARLTQPFTKLPAAARIGATGDPQLAYRTGRALARELRCAGVDIDFAPVLDIHSNPRNEVIGDRAFGRTPEVVAEMAIALQRGLLDGGIIPCGKHFPGHGDTIEDSHFALPSCARSRAELEARELRPFRAAITAGLPMIMTAHVVYPALDSSAPATLSPRLVQELLRDELGFEGVIATDDMDMRAVVDGYEPGEAAVLALAAGCDLVLVCQSLATAAQARDAIVAALVAGRLPESRMEEAVARMDHLRTLRPSPARSACPLPNLEHAALVTEIDERCA